MTIAFKAHFDGKVIVPEEAVDLPSDRQLLLRVDTPGMKEQVTGESALQWLANHAVDDELPTDLSVEHDHYLYGTPKRG
jgi:hypothetical protein